MQLVLTDIVKAPAKVFHDRNHEEVPWGMVKQSHCLIPEHGNGESSKEALKEIDVLVAV